MGWVKISIILVYAQKKNGANIHKIFEKGLGDPKAIL